VFEELPPGVCPWAFSLEVDEKEVFLESFAGAWCGRSETHGVQIIQLSPSGVFPRIGGASPYRDPTALFTMISPTREIKYIADQVNELLEGYAPTLSTETTFGLLSLISNRKTYEFRRNSQSGSSQRANCGWPGGSVDRRNTYVARIASEPHGGKRSQVILLLDRVQTHPYSKSPSST